MYRSQLLGPIRFRKASAYKLCYTAAMGSTDYASPFMAIAFYPLLAIISVPLAAIILCYSIRGMYLAEPQRKNLYVTMFAVTAGLNLLFFPAVARWQWMSPATMYDSAYHFFGYFGNMLLYLIILVLVSKDKVGSPRIGLVAFSSTFVYLIVVGIILSPFNITATTDAQSYKDAVRLPSVLIGIGYALFQVILPLIEWWIVKNNIDKLRALVAAKKAAPRIVYVPVPHQPNSVPVQYAEGSVQAQSPEPETPAIIADAPTQNVNEAPPHDEHSTDRS